MMSPTAAHAVHLLDEKLYESQAPAVQLIPVYATSADGLVCLSLTGMCMSAAAFVGQGMGVGAWLVEAHIEFGELSTTTLQQIGPALTGGCFSLFISLILTIVLSFIFPQNFDWNDMKSITVFNDISKDVSSTSTVLSCAGTAPSLHLFKSVYTFTPCTGFQMPVTSPCPVIPFGSHDQSFSSIYSVMQEDARW